MKQRSAIIFIGDVHLRHDTPRSRLDGNPTPVILKKLKYIFDYASFLTLVDTRIDGIVFGGDLGHKPHWDSKTIVGFGNLLNDYPSLNFYTVIGNHDVPGRELSEVDNTVLGLFIRAGLITRLNSKKHKIMGNFGALGFDSDDPKTEKFITGLISCPMLLDILNVAIVHAPVGPINVPHQIKYTDVNILEGTDFAFFADIHEGFPIHKLESGCVIANPGSIYRSSISDIDRKPQFALLYDDGSLSYVEISCESADVVFDREATLTVKAQKKQSSCLSLRAALVKAETAYGEMNPVEMVNQVGTKAKFELESITRAADEVRIAWEKDG